MDIEKELFALKLGERIITDLIVNEGIAPDIVVKAVRHLAQVFDNIEAAGMKHPTEGLGREPATPAAANGGGFADGTIV